MNQRTKPRLGRGLSALLSQPVSVEVIDSPAEAMPQEPQKASLKAGERADRVAAPASVQTSELDGRRLRAVELDRVVPNRHQPRRSFDQAQLTQLAESIRAAGLMQPVLVRPVGDAPGAEYELIAGERRWRAARLAGLSSIPAIVVTLSERESAEWALVENLQREDLNPIDRAVAFRGLIEGFSLTQNDVAERIGIDRSSVANFLRLLELEPEVQELVRLGTLSLGHAKALLSAPASAVRLRAAVQMAREGWTVRRAEQWASAQRATTVRQVAAAAPTAAAAVRNELERQLGDYLGTKVNVQSSGPKGRGRLIIDFYDRAQFEGVLERIGFRLES